MTTVRELSTLEKTAPGANRSVYDSENAILTAMIRGGGQIAAQICSRISADDFTYEEQEIAFRSFQKLIEAGHAPTPAALREALSDAMNADPRKERLLFTYTGPAHFAEKFVAARFADTTDCVKNAPLHCERITNYALLRRMSDFLEQSKALTDLHLKGEAPELNAAEVVAALQSGILNLSPAMPEKTSVPELLPGFMEKLWAEYDEPFGVMRGLDTGFPTMNRLTQGFQPGHMVIISAGTGVGKSALTLNFVLNAARGYFKKHNRPLGVQVFSHEMSKDELLERMIFSEARVDINRFFDKKLSQDEKNRLQSAKEYMDVIAAAIDLHDDRRYTAKRIASICRQAAFKGRCNMFIADYAQIIPPEKTGRMSEMREQQVAAISDAFLCLAGELKVPGIVISQLNKDGTTRESARLEQDCYLHGTLSRLDANDKEKKVYLDDEPIPHVLELVKARGMKKGKVYLNFRGGMTRFDETDMGQW